MRPTVSPRGARRLCAAVDDRHAIAAARRVVDEYLQSAFEPGMNSDTLLATYLQFGEDPFIIASDAAHSGVLFSARDYARERCEEICS